jgi:hypothetical protein
MLLRSFLAVAACAYAASATTVIVFTPTTIAANATSINGVPLSSAEITVVGTTLTIDGRHTIYSLSLVRDNSNSPAVLTHSPAATFNYGAGDTVYGLALTVTHDLTIQDATSGVASRIDVDAKGFAAGTGPGAGQSSTDGSIGGTGGGYGGLGASSGPYSGGSAYGSFTSPVNLGSGGGAYVGNTAGAGGGCIRLIVNGTLTIGGTISANGGSGSVASGGGSGGSIWITATSNIEGFGQIFANGGDGSGWGGGGGGRIAIDHLPNTGTGVQWANGGLGASSNQGRGGAGTKCDKVVGRPIALTMSAGGLPMGAATPVDTILPSDTSVLIGVGANVEFNVAQPHLSVLAMTGYAALKITDQLSLGGLYLLDSDNIITSAQGRAATITVSQNCLIDAGSAINVDGKGFAANSGPGAGAASTDSAYGANGGAHAGNGVGSPLHAGSAAYGLISQPVTMGSGGGDYFGSVGGSGGGAIRLNVAGTLTLRGSISANGTAGQGAAGCGAGGSIYVTADTIEGNGSMYARGGEGSWGGGSGGRIAITCNHDLYTGSVNAPGGSSPSGTPAHGAAGTVYVRRAANRIPELMIDNASNAPGAATPIDDDILSNVDLFTISHGANVELNRELGGLGDILVSGGSRLQLSGHDGTFGSLSVLGGSTVVPPPHTPEELVVLGDLFISADSSISADGLGFPEMSGPGAGQSSTDGSIGGAGGGYGGNGDSSGVFGGGFAYGSIANPDALGSGGGRYFGSPAGAGGGAFAIYGVGTLTVDGVLSANGQAGVSASGSGSGGSILVAANTLAGNGTISANGGNGNAGWGGGGGGRISFHVDHNEFAGTTTAFGGTSPSSVYRIGGAGTVYKTLYFLSDPHPSLSVIAGGSSIGAMTPLLESTAAETVDIRSGAYVASQVEQEFAGDLNVTSSSRLELFGRNTVAGNLSISGPASTLSPARGATMAVSVAHNTFVIDGGAVNGDSLGYPGAAGPGAGQDSTDGAIGGAGGGYGGAGGAAGPFAGGAPYGSASDPVDMGSGGGIYPGFAPGFGGGAVKIETVGTLRCDGSISCNGQDGSGPSGAGSGGGIFLRAASIEGTGTITSRGGSSPWGGGGGGRVGIFSCNVLLPLANITANAGSAGLPGSDGTVYFGSSSVHITQQPEGSVLPGGASAELSVGATGAGTLHYQWRRRSGDGSIVNLSEGQSGIYFGVNTPTLSIQGISCSGGGDFDCLVCDSCGCFPTVIVTVGIVSIADFNNDGGVDGSDVDAFFAAWEDGNPSADVNVDGGVDGADIGTFFEHWEAGGC